jgi:hypothetical protein
MSKLDDLLIKHYGISQVRAYELCDALIEEVKGEISRITNTKILGFICQQIDLAYKNLKEDK